MRIALIANTPTSLPSIVNFNDGSAPQFSKIKKGRPAFFTPIFFQISVTHC